MPCCASHRVPSCSSAPRSRGDSPVGTARRCCRHGHTERQRRARAGARGGCGSGKGGSSPRLASAAHPHPSAHPHPPCPCAGGRGAAGSGGGGAGAEEPSPAQASPWQPAAMARSVPPGWLPAPPSRQRQRRPGSGVPRGGGAAWRQRAGAARVMLLGQGCSGARIAAGIESGPRLAGGAASAERPGKGRARLPASCARQWEGSQQGTAGERIILR